MGVYLIRNKKDLFIRSMFYGIIVRVKTGGMFFLAVKEVAERWGLPLFLDSSGNETNGTGLDLYEILMTIQEHPFLKDADGVQEHFGNMFAADVLIDNEESKPQIEGKKVQPNVY